MRRRALKRAAEKRRLAEEVLSDGADGGGSEGGLGSGLEAGYDPLGSPQPETDSTALIPSNLRSNRSRSLGAKGEWPLTAAVAEGGTPRQSPSSLADAALSQGQRGKGPAFPAPFPGFSVQNSPQDGIEMQASPQSPRRSEDGASAEEYRQHSAPGPVASCQVDVAA